jgi:transcriptional regulator with XRE-family HTH domain
MTAGIAGRGKDVLFLDDAEAERFGRRVRAWLVLNDIESGDVAVRFRVSRYQLSRVLHGRVAFSLSLAMDLAEWTGLSLDGDDVHGPPRTRLDSSPAAMDSQGTPVAARDAQTAKGSWIATKEQP